MNYRELLSWQIQTRQGDIKHFLTDTEKHTVSAQGVTLRKTLEAEISMLKRIVDHFVHPRRMTGETLIWHRWLRDILPTYADRRHEHSEVSGDIRRRASQNRDTALGTLKGVAA